MNLSIKRRSYFWVLTLLLVICCTMWTGKKVQAAEEGGYTYEPSDVNTVTITGYTGTATTLTVPSQLGGCDVTAIGYRAFAETNIVNVSLPSCITSIGDGAFCDCVELTTVSLPDSIKIIANSTFLGCTKLNNVIIPSGITSIQEFAFSECSNLTDITFPSSLSSISSDAFTECTALKSITLSEGVSSVNPNAFAECTALEKINVVSSNAYYKAEDGVLYNANKTKLILYPAGRKNIAYEVPSTVTTIGDYAFSYTTVTQKIYISETVTTISSKSFCNVRNQLKVCIQEGSTAETYVKNNEIPYDYDYFVSVTELQLEGESVVKLPLSEKTYQIEVNILPSNASDPMVTYVSSQPLVATVSDTGLVTLKTTGYTRITAKCGNYSTYVSFVVEHEKGTYHDGTSATCVSEGSVEYWDCLDCDEKLDEQGIVIPDTIIPINSLNHVNVESTITTPATEAAEGEITYTCTACEATWTETIPVLTHEKGTHHEAVAATCVETGTVEYWDCKNCDQKLDEDGNVIDDITVAINSSNHANVEESIITPATETDEGEANYTCTACNASWTDKIPKLNHEKGTHHEAVSATCTKEGTVEYWDCKNCDQKLDEDGNVIDDITVAIDPSNHKTELRNKKSATYLAAGYTGDTYCTLCGKEISSGNSISKLVLAAPTSLKLKAYSKSMLVSFKKASNASGTQIQYSLKKSMAKAKTRKITGKSVKIKKLVGKKIYYVRVRSYKKVGSKTVYSKWSSIKKVKIKK